MIWATAFLSWWYSGHHLQSIPFLQGPDGWIRWKYDGNYSFCILQLLNVVIISPTPRMWYWSEIDWPFIWVRVGATLTLQAKVPACVIPASKSVNPIIHMGPGNDHWTGSWTQLTHSKQILARTLFIFLASSIYPPWQRVMTLDYISFFRTGSRSHSLATEARKMTLFSMMND